MAKIGYSHSAIPSGKVFEVEQGKWMWMFVLVLVERKVEPWAVGSSDGCGRLYDGTNLTDGREFT